MLLLYEMIMAPFQGPLSYILKKDAIDFQMEVNIEF